MLQELFAFLFFLPMDYTIYDENELKRTRLLIYWGEAFDQRMKSFLPRRVNSILFKLKHDIVIFQQ